MGARFLGAGTGGARPYTTLVESPIRYNLLNTATRGGREFSFTSGKTRRRRGAVVRGSRLIECHIEVASGLYDNPSLYVRPDLS